MAEIRFRVNLVRGSSQERGELGHLVSLSPRKGSQGDEHVEEELQRRAGSRRQDPIRSTCACPAAALDPSRSDRVQTFQQIVNDQDCNDAACSCPGTMLALLAAAPTCRFCWLFGACHRAGCLSL